MTKLQLVARVAKEAGVRRQDAARVVDQLINTVLTTLRAGGKVNLTGLGTLRVKPRKGRTGRNPKTGQPVVISPGRKVSFKPSQSLRKSLR